MTKEQFETIKNTLANIAPDSVLIRYSDVTKGIRVLCYTEGKVELSWEEKGRIYYLYDREITEEVSTLEIVDAFKHFFVARMCRDAEMLTDIARL